MNTYKLEKLGKNKFSFITDHLINYKIELKKSNFFYLKKNKLKENLELFSISSNLPKNFNIPDHKIGNTISNYVINYLLDNKKEAILFFINNEYEDEIRKKRGRQRIKYFANLVKKGNRIHNCNYAFITNEFYIINKNKYYLDYLGIIIDINSKYYQSIIKVFNNFCNINSYKNLTMKRNIILWLILLLIIPYKIFPQNDSTIVKEYKLEEVVVKSNPISVIHKNDRIIYNFANQPYLNSGNLSDGLKKIPGIFISDLTGIIYKGKPLEVYIDSRKSNLYSDELNSYLQGVPANTIEKIELITNPGSEFPANSGGAILNLITSRIKSNNYFGLSYSNGLSITNYNKYRTKFNNSIFLYGKNKYTNWELNFGQSTNPTYSKSQFYNDQLKLTDLESDRKSNYYFLKPGIKWIYKKNKIYLNYSISNNNQKSNINSQELSKSIDPFNISRNTLNQNLSIFYEKEFKTNEKKLNFSINNFDYKSDNAQKNTNTKIEILQNSSIEKTQEYQINYNQKIDFLDETKLGLGLLSEKIIYSTTNFQIQNFDYKRLTNASFINFQFQKDYFDLKLGSRIESYNIDGFLNNQKINPFKQTKFFPNLSFQYTLLDDVFLKINYNKKIRLPDVASLNPNNTNFQNNQVQYSGNPNLNPTISNNFEINFSAYEYLFIGFEKSYISNNVNRRILFENNLIKWAPNNISNIVYKTINFGLPIPFMLFSKGLKETLKFDFNPDEINFLNFYAEYQKYSIPNLIYKGNWYFEFFTQINLPEKFILTNYFSTSTKGNIYFYKIIKPLNKQFDINISRKFEKNNLSISLYLNDIFNWNKYHIQGIETPIIYLNKVDTRKFGFSLIYNFSKNNKFLKSTDNEINTQKKINDNLDF